MKRPESMTPDERLARIRSLERKVSRLEWEKHLAEQDQASVRRWAEEAWEEVRHLRDMCTLHWNEKQEIRRAAGLDVEPSLVPLAKFNHDTRQWEPIDALSEAALTDQSRALTSRPLRPFDLPEQEVREP